MFEPEMVFIRPGRFMMGSNGLDTERPIHKVTIAYPFAIGQYPVTFKEFDAFCSATGHRKSHDEGWGRGNRPVINVNWYGAAAYCAWLSEQTGKTYRLPSEAEWEYACRAGGKGAYCFGDDRSMLDDFAWYKENAGGKTHPVGKKKPNAWGLHDMHGNVCEWCEDGWHDNYQGAPADGSAWESEICGDRLLRGGSWYSHPSRVRSASRVSVSGGPSYRRGYGIGFRVARVF